ncbi:hypothetical protein OXX80_011928, partial [Metschnikowia pulcherrima]
KRQRLDDFEGDVSESESPWKRVTRLRVDSLSVDHLNKGLEGPFGWISAGKVDMMGDVMVPEDARDYNMADIVQIVADSIHKEATRYRNPGVAPKRESRLSPEDVSQFFVLDLTLRLNNVRASVPFQAPELSYVNYALIRPIVAYINSRNAFIEIKARVVKSLADFAGSWTVYDSLLMDDISESVYDSFVNYVADDESRLMRMRKIAFWSVQVLVQVVVLGLGAATVADESLSAFNDWTSGKRSKFTIFALSPEKSPITVDKTSSDDEYESFLWEIGGGEGKRTKIVYYTWSPDDARSKMVYASSKDSSRRALNGIAADIQGTYFFKVAYDSMTERVSRGAGSH